MGRQPFRLEEIGFYTLSDRRALTSTGTSPMQRCELILLDSCNFACPYCRGLRSDCKGIMSLGAASDVLAFWIHDGLQNVRFSGGEPTLYDGLEDLVYQCRRGRVKRIAVSTNGSAEWEVYKKLYDAGVNDCSISFDACCAGDCKTMSGIDIFSRITENIQALSGITYVSVGVVLTEHNVGTLRQTVEMASSLGVDDIRIIPAAQNDALKLGVSELKGQWLNRHPILRYRIDRFLKDRPVRGLRCADSHTCRLLRDDSVVAGKWHFPCVIYLREGGNPIGEIGPRMRQERLEWINKTDTHCDPICKKNCLDVCVAYNNKAEQYSLEN